jgi:hypothetical protein
MSSTPPPTAFPGKAVTVTVLELETGTMQELIGAVVSPASTLLQAARISLSSTRMATYEAAALQAGMQAERAMDLYGWNAQISSALLTPLHLCEVVVRNAVSQVLTLQYGPGWPSSTGFLRSLPSTKGAGYDAKSDLIRISARHSVAGGVVAELKNVFWEKLFIKRNDQRLWTPYIFQLFPNLDHAQPVSVHRQRIAKDLESIRRLRNRIAHHEPIFRRDLRSDFQKISELIQFRCRDTARWMDETQAVLAVLDSRPF